RAGAKGNADQRPRTGLSAGHAWYWCWRAYIKLQSLIVSTRGGNRMRESCEYGSVRGARGNSRPYRVRRREVITLLGCAAVWVQINSVLLIGRVLVHPSGIEGLIILARGPRYSARGFPV